MQYFRVPKGKLAMSDNQSHRMSEVPPPVFSRFVEDEDLSVAGQRPQPCFYSRISDENLSAAGPSPAYCTFSRVSDEDLSAGSAARPPVGPCVTSCWGGSDEDISAAGMVRPPVGYCFASDEELSSAALAAPMPCTFSRVDSDEDLSAAGLSATGMAKCRPLFSVISDEDMSVAGMIRPTPSCSCFVSDSDEELLADSGQSH